MTHISVIPSRAFQSVLEELALFSGAPDAVKNVLSRKSKVLTSADIRWCHNKIKEYGLPHHMHQLLSGCELILPEYKPPPRSPELEARIQKLRAEQANREYQKMTKNLVLDQYELATLRGIGTDVRNLKVEIREMNRQIVTGAQYLVSIIGTFFGVFIGLGYAVNELGPRIMVAIFCAFVVAMAEVYFIIRQDIVKEEKTKKVV